MRIVLAAHSLVGLGGSETYATTVADHLQRLGHDVWLHSPDLGPAADAARRLGVRVCDEHGLPPAPDVLVVQDGIVACTLAERYPLTPQAFVAHSDIFDLQLPPQLPGVVAVVIALYDRVERRIRALATPYEIVRLTQPVDVERFKPNRPLRAEPRVAMTVGNYVHGPRLDVLAGACARSGIELRHVGMHSPTGTVALERVYDEADVVFGKARVVIEAMACGRAAYVFDHNGGDGWVTAESYPRLAPDNFGGQSDDDPIDEDRLVADLRGYDARMGTVNRDLVVARHAASKHAAALVEVLTRLAPRPAPVDAPLAELARMIRLYHRADTQSFALYADSSRLGARLHELERAQSECDTERASFAAERHRLERERDEAIAERDARAAEAARLAAALDELRGTRRWRAVQAALAPADRLRAGRTGHR
jgi:glycosyltransferase involved in cell wall biosynthesis